jgi:hypothetical protein
MADVIKLPRKAYGVDVIEKKIDGETVECLDIDGMSEEQFRKYCADTNTEWFQRMTIGI